MQNSKMRPWRSEDCILVLISREFYDVLNTDETVPKNRIIVTRKHQNSKHNLIGHLDYNVGQDESNPRTDF